MKRGKGNGSKHTVIFAAIILCSCVLIPVFAVAAEYPSKPIQMVVGYAPGGPTSLAARILSEDVSKELGVPVVVVNKPGASGTIAATLVAKSKPDGYTLLVATSANLSAAFSLVPDVTYKLSDFAPIAQHISVPVTISVKKDAPWKTLQEFIQDAKKNPGKFKAGSDGGGMSITMQALLETEQLKVAHMIAKGAVPNVTSLLSGEINISAVSYPSVLPQVEAGNVRILAASLRLKEYPSVPTIADAGFTDISRDFWNGLFVPAGTPQSVIAKLVPAFQKVITSPAVAGKIEKLGLIPHYREPKEFSSFLQKEYEIWTQLGKKYKITQ